MKLLDTRYDIETPEGIDLALRPAGPLPRALAYLVDVIVRVTIWVVCLLILAWAGVAGMGLFLIVYFLLEWLYPVLFEVYRGGMTPGKKTMGIHVVNDDGTPVGWGTSLVRNLLRTVDFLPFGYVAGLFSMIMAGNFKRLGDLAAGTMVVYNQDKKNTKRIEVDGAKPLPLSLNIDEQRALLDFSESKGRLSVQRQQELANILTPVTGKQNEESVEELVKFANGLTGRE